MERLTLPFRFESIILLIFVTIQGNDFYVIVKKQTLLQKS